MKKLMFYSIGLSILFFIVSMGFSSHIDKQQLKTFVERSINTKFKIHEKIAKKQEKTFEGQVQDYQALEITGVSTDVEIQASSSEKMLVEYPEHQDQQLRPKSRVEGKNKTIVYNLEEYFETNDEYFNNLSFTLNWDKTGFVNIQAQHSNRVRLSVPSNITKILIKTTSGDIKVQNLNLNQLQLQTVSGDMNLADLQIDNLMTNAVSGDLRFEGAATNIVAESVSGLIKLNNEKGDNKIEAESTSGDIRVHVKTEPNATVTFDTTSGDFKSSLASKNEESDKNLNTFLLGRGQGRWNFKTVSGDIRLMPDQSLKNSK